MNLYNKHITVLLSLCAAFAACNDELNDATNPDAGKTPIELKVGEESVPTTRAVVIDGNGYVTAFEKDTRLHLLMISEDATTPNPASKEYTVTYATAKGSGEAPSADTNGSKSQVSFASDEGITRYWDDTHGRSSQLSIYGLATANVVKAEGAPWFQKLCGTGSGWNSSGYESDKFVGTKTSPSVPWSVNPDDKYGTKIGANTTSGKWIIGDITNNYSVQTKTSVMNKDDLCYSNNIADHSSEDGGVDGRMKFSNKQQKKFDDGNLVFHRAMTLFTIKLYAGIGYNPTSSDNFQFTKDANNKPTNIALKGFNKAGYLNIKEGTWSEVETGDWASIDNTDYGAPNLTGSGPYWTLLAFVIPGTDIANTDKKDAMSFTIDNNYFEVSMKDLYNAIKGNAANLQNDEVKNTVLDGGTKLKAGINYEFSLTIGKTAINKITAQVVDWETVTATNFSPTNARIDIKVETQRGTPATEVLDFYRAHDDATSITDNHVSYKWMTGYTEDGNKSGSTYHAAETDGEGHITKQAYLSLNETWYWESNLTYYHFRTVQPASHEVHKGNPEATQVDDKCDYIELEASATNSITYKDVKWGAPFMDLKESNERELFEYDPATGYDVNKGTGNPHQIYQAIGPTLNTIVIIPFHMMSDVTIYLTTPSEGQSDRVDLTGATISLVNAYTTGKVLMGNGKVVETGSRTTDEAPASISYDSSNSCYHYGAIPQDLTGVSLVIQTADNNRYIVNLENLYTETPPTPGEIQNPYTATDGKYTINRWYPGFKYVYTLHLTKKGIDNFKATIVDWEEVVINQGGIQIQ